MPIDPRAIIRFTIHVTPATTTIDTDTITPDIQRIPTNDDVEPVSDHLTFDPPAGNNRIRYEVVRGSGTLYVGTLIDQHTTPITAISVHQSSKVYINTNGSSNEVHVWFAGEDRSAPRATIVFEYRGQPVPTTRITPVTPVTPVTPTGSLTITATGYRHDAVGDCCGDQRAGNSRFNFSHAEWHGYFNASPRERNGDNDYTADGTWGVIR